MTPVFQSIVDQGRGDCQRAAIASLFDLKLEQVPHFKLFGPDWWRVYYYFLMGIGYEFHGTSMGDRHRDKRNYDSVNGFFLATVPSRSYEGVRHSVIIDEKGVIVHDPNPNGLWQGVNVVESGDLVHVDIIERMDQDKKADEDLAAVLKRLLEMSK